VTTHAPQKRANWHDAYDAQMSLWRFYRTDLGMRFLASTFQKDTEGLPRETREQHARVYLTERERMLDLDPIYVSGEMCELVDAAKDSFDPEPLIETDLVTPYGFLYYERPFTVPDRFESPTHIQALSWMLFYVVKDEEQKAEMKKRAGPFPSGRAIKRELEEEGILPRGIQLTVYASSDGTILPVPVAPIHLTPWFFDMTFDGNEWDEIGKPTGAEWWWRIAQTTFRLMQQKISAKHLHRPDRHSRREAKRLAFPEDREVVVVRLRREEGERNEPAGETANYSHRFIVSGHWRQQWYPSVSQHRQIWISPFVKGDAGLPLIVRPRRVFQWQR